MIGSTGRLELPGFGGELVELTLRVTVVE